MNPIGKAPLFLPDELFYSFRGSNLLLIGIHFGCVVYKELVLIACLHVGIYEVVHTGN